ncbi:hypothetical protein M0P65_05905 [Candidatus Gracilibacteria bacterium]|jgi:hypothetical protein|nr:hypothetical protein [Candidatus Gracilibacteria bacterium]
MANKIGNTVLKKEKTPKEILEKLFRDEYENDDTKTEMDKLILLMEIVIDQLNDLRYHSHTINY